MLALNLEEGEGVTLRGTFIERDGKLVPAEVAIHLVRSRRRLKMSFEAPREIDIGRMKAARMKEST